MLLRQSGAHHVDHIKADECLEQAHVRLCQGAAGEIALLAQSLLAPVQRRKQLPAMAYNLSTSQAGLQRCLTIGSLWRHSTHELA